MLRTLVIDDEAPARRRIKRLLAAEPGVAIVGECGDGASAIDLIASARPDLVFLDVQMPERDGFEVVAALTPQHLPAILFVTAYDQYALRAFEVHAVDYLLKPFTGERFRTALARARERIARRAEDRGLASLATTLRNRPAYLTRLPVRTGGRMVFVDLDAVDWMEAADNYVRLHVKQREYLVRETLGTLEAKLDPDRFARIHRSAIVHLDRVAEWRPTSHGDATLQLRDGTRLAVSRTWASGLKSRLSQFAQTDAGRLKL
jgi:two-component system LytT family response regulator